MKSKILIPKTALEAIEQLYIFFQEDMWYAKHAEWKTQKDMLKYLKSHFDLCKKQIKQIEKSKK